MKINCDMGESFGLWQLGQDSAVMPYVDMANIACGMHASDPTVMRSTVKLAKDNNVLIGAHPGYPDIQGFGRRYMAMSSEDLESCIIYQLGALQGICQSEDATMNYVKPHGALYNAMMKDDQVFHTVLSAIKKFNKTLPLVVMAVPDYQHYQALSDEYGIHLWFEAFVDRAYDENGRLMPRTEPNSCHTTLEKVDWQAKQLMESGSVTTHTGKTVYVKADTLCIHGDGPLALSIAQRLRMRVDNI